MEVGRVGDLRIWDGSIVRLPLVGDRLYRCRTKNLSRKKERPKANCAFRWWQSAVRIGRPRKTPGHGPAFSWKWRVIRPDLARISLCESPIALHWATYPANPCPLSAYG